MYNPGCCCLFKPQTQNQIASFDVTGLQVLLLLLLQLKINTKLQPCAAFRQPAAHTE